MREWSISEEDPYSLRLAADVRLTQPDYLDDQIWELILGGGEPPALALQTSYGLRARGMRIFPSFGWGQATVTDPSLFTSSPILKVILPNYLRVMFHPFSDLRVVAEYWIVESQILAGRFTLNNQGSEQREAQVRLHAVLRPGENPQAMAKLAFDGVTVLAGQTGPLTPVVFLSGGAVVEEAVYPALVVSQNLAPGSEKGWAWSHVGLSDTAQSFGAAREVASRPWDEEIAHLELLAASTVDIETGEPTWDIALALAQKIAVSSYVGPTRHLPHPSFVLARLPDRGYSERGDGKDYDWQWDGQTAAHAYINVSQILPITPELAQGVIHNFIATQAADGSIDWKPGLGGQRNGALSIPLLATLAWRIYRHTQDDAFLEVVFPSLIRFLDSWFSKAHDRDQDGHPEWDHTTHTAFDDQPTFVRWRRWAQRLEIGKAETPDLASFLYRECMSLIEMSRELGQEEFVSELETRASRLREAVELSWSDKTSCYHHLDRDIHQAVPGEVLGVGKGEFVLEVERTFKPSVRVLIRTSGAEDLSHAVKVFIHGRGRRGRHRVERLSERHFQWFWEFGAATSDKTYAEIERIEVRGLSDAFETELCVADYTRQDQSLLVPLWAGIPSGERVERLVRDTVLDENRFWREFGIPSCSAEDPAYASDNQEGAGGVWFFWNTLIGEGLIDYGYIEEAVELVTRLLNAAVHTLRVDKAFREAYDADKLQGLGERDHLWGVAPVHLFLYVLGVRLISPTQIWIRGLNPFPWPVTLRWRGLLLECLKDQTVITFPNGQRVETSSDVPQFVEQKISP
jgi:glycogen debranching enzyme